MGDFNWTDTLVGMASGGLLTLLLGAAVVWIAWRVRPEPEGAYHAANIVRRENEKARRSDPHKATETSMTGERGRTSEQSGTTRNPSLLSHPRPGAPPLPRPVPRDEQLESTSVPMQRPYTAELHLGVSPAPSSRCEGPLREPEDIQTALTGTREVGW